MLPDWVSNPGPLTYESGALPIALRGLALQPLTMMHVIPLMMPRLSVQFNEVCLGTFLSNC